MSLVHNLHVKWSGTPDREFCTTFPEEDYLDRGGILSKVPSNVFSVNL